MTLDTFSYDGLEFDDRRFGSPEFDQVEHERYQRAQARIAPEYKRHRELTYLPDDVGVFSRVHGSRERVLKLMSPLYIGICDIDFVSDNSLDKDGDSMVSSIEGEASSGRGIQVVDQKVYDTAVFRGKKAYEILSISPDASINDAKIAYQRLTRLYHPDREPWVRKGKEFDVLIDELEKIGLTDINEDTPWGVNRYDPGLIQDGGGYMVSYISSMKKIIKGALTFKKDQSSEAKLETIEKAKQALVLMDEYIRELGHKFYQVCKAYELFKEGFGSLDIFGTHLTWTHHYRIPVDQYGNNVVEGSVIELPGTHAKIFVPILWIQFFHDSFRAIGKQVLHIKDFDNIRLTEAILTFDTLTEDDIFSQGKVFSRSSIPFECRIFDIIGIIEWYGDGHFSSAYTQALASRFPKIKSPELVLTSYLDGDISDDDLKQYGDDFYSVAGSIKQRGSYGLELLQTGEVLFFQNDTTLRFTREDLEILRYIALNLNLIRQSILMQINYG